MCGICGFVGPEGPATLTAMNDRLRHRGPDAAGEWADAARGVRLGHRRLSIIDLASGAQPMESADGSLVTVYNGEIYNHAELRRELEDAGLAFRTDHSDTEVLLNGYLHWGAAVLDRCNGMWAFAIWDRRSNELFLARDRFGKKPLYWAAGEGWFAFASELTALALYPAVRTETDRLSLQKYFAYGFIPAPRTLYRDVHKLPAGHLLRVRVGADGPGTVSAPEVRRWWSFELDPFAGTPRDPEEEWGGRIRELLDRAVARRLMSDVPLGVFLSGGIDSSSVAAFAARHVGPGELRTFSIGFGERSFDESAYSDLMARQLGTAHENCRLTPDQARDLLPAAAAGLDEPMGDSSFLPTYLLCRETRRHVTVALGGDGADELFAGYAPFRALRAARAWSALVPGFAHRGARLAAALLPVSHNYMSLGFKISRTLRGLSQPPALWNPVWLGPLEPDELAELFAAPVDPDDVYAEAIEAWNSCAGDDVDRTLQFYTRLYLADDILVKADRASMLNSLEVRSPYLDIELVDFVRRIPSAWKLRRGTTKYILKKALEPVLPREIIHRSKQGFAMPVGRWLADGAVAVDPARTAQGLSRDFVRARLEAHRRGRADERLFLWNVWLLGQGSFADSTSPAGPGERA